jgi:hypothetical protein
MVRTSWFPLAAVLAVAPLAGGCASTPTSRAFVDRVTPGLANVPWISHETFQDDQRSPDVVSNGLDACGRNLDHGMLWNQWPPCPSTGPHPVAGKRLLPTSNAVASADLVRPWQESTVFPWPCTPAEAGGEIKGVRCR